MVKARKTLVFDLDGTLIDSAPDLHAALARLLAEEGRPSVSLADIKEIVGDGAAKMIERGFARTGAPLDPAELPRLFRRYLGIYEGACTVLTRPFPGVVEALTRLQGEGYRFGVCTNKPYRPTLQILEGLGLRGWFAAVSGGDSGPTRKPDPGHLLATLAAMGAEPAEAVMIGDSANDVLAARGCGVPVMVLPHGYGVLPAAELNADLVLEEFAALPAALQRPPFAPGA